MIKVKVGRKWHVAQPVGPQTWQNRGEEGSVLVAAHVLYCDPNHFVGILNVHGERPNLRSKNFCKPCRQLVTDRIRRLEELDALRTAGRPTSLYEQMNQGTWWKTKEGSWVRIDEMEESHAANLVTFLERRASRYALAYSWQSAMSMPDAADCGDMTFDALQREQSLLERQVYEDPLTWLRDTPLYRALVARTFK